MSRPILGLIGLLVALVTVILIPRSDAAEDLQDPVTLTGCLRTGSVATVLILRGATAPGAVPDGSQMPRDYLLVALPDGLDMTALLNHQIAVTGVVRMAADGPAPPEGANTAERALRRLSVSSVADVAAACPEP